MLLSTYAISTSVISTYAISTSAMSTYAISRRRLVVWRLVMWRTLSCMVKWVGSVDRVRLGKKQLDTYLLHMAISYIWLLDTYGCYYYLRLLI